MNADRLLALYERVAEAPDAVPRLRRFVLDLAVRGKLVTQDPTDEPASELLKRIAAEKARLMKAGEIKKPKALPVVDEEPFDLPSNWRWVRIREVTSDRGQRIPDGDFTYIDVTAINKEAGVVAEPNVLAKDEAPSRARKIAAKGDVLYSCVRPYLLNVAVLDQDFDPAPIASTAFAVLNGHGLVLPWYLWIALRSPFMVECVEANQRGQAYPAINDKDFSLLPFPLPPLAEQRRIVAKVEELMALLDRLEAARGQREATRDRLTAASLARLTAPDADPEAESGKVATGIPSASTTNKASFPANASFALAMLPALTTRPDQIKPLRQTILNLAVRGKLVAQDPTDEPASELLKRIATERARLVREGAIRSKKQPRPLADDELPFEAPSGWRWTTLAQAFVVTGGIQKTPARTPKDNAFPYLGVGNVYRNRIDLTNLKKFELQDGELEKFRLKPFDIMVVEGNGSASEIGRCAMWEGQIEDCVHQNHLIRCRPIEPDVSRYAMLYLNSPLGMGEMTELAITSAGLYNLSVGKISKIAIPLPPLAEQHRILAKVDALMALCDRLEAALTTTDTTRARLLEAVLHEALDPAAKAVTEAAE